MENKKPVKQIVNTNGTILTGFGDGSYVIIDPSTGAVVDENTFPNPSRAAAWASGDTSHTDELGRIASTENTRRWDATFEQKDRELAQRYKVEMANAKSQQQQAKATREYQQGQLQNLRDRLAFDRVKQAQDLGLQQAGLGYNLIKTGAELRGPENYFQASNYARGVAAQPGTAGFLSALQNNTQLAGYGAQIGAPDAASVGGLTAKLTGQAGNADDGYLNQIHSVGAAGGHKIGAGKWEQMTDTERKLFLSGLEAPGADGKAYDANTFLSQLRASRIGNRFGSALAA